jgi:hypothetical protein
MKFPQILMLLVLSCMLIFSCRENVAKEDKEDKEVSPENSVPSSDYNHGDESAPNKTYPKPGQKSRDSVLRKRRKSRDLDTLIPKVALLG